MQKWEYLDVESAYNRVLAINGTEVDDWQNGTRMIDFLNEMGDQGWELIAIEENRYLFKRPKE